MYAESGTFAKFRKHGEEVLVCTSDQGGDFEIPESPLLGYNNVPDYTETLVNLQSGRLWTEDVKPFELHFLPNTMRIW